MSKYHSKKVYGDSTGPFGFPMPSGLAHAAEEALKKQSSEVRNLFKTTVVGADGKSYQVDGYARRIVTPKAMDFDDGEHADTSIITADNVDRDNEVLLPEGIDFSQFLKNPVVPFNHKYDQLPIGRCLWIAATKVDNGSGFKAKTRYTPRPETHPESAEWFPDTVWHFVKQGDLRGKSIGFVPLSIRTPTTEDLQARPDWKDADRLIDEAMALEYSTATVPANQVALSDAVAKAFTSGFKVGKDFLAAAGIMLPLAVPTVSKVEKPARTVVFIPAPKTLVIPQTIIPAQRSKSMMPVAAKYAHLNFTPPKDMQKNMKDGLDRHNAGESKGHATPEMCAMAMHCGAGGDMSPKMAKSCKGYHDDNAMHLSAEPGTPAHCLAMMHGGAVGKAYVTNLCKAMDAADAAQTAPGPATAVDENGGPADDKDMDGGEMDESMKGKSRRRKGDAMGAMENMNGTGGYVDPGEDDDETPPCPTCKTNINVEKAETMGYKCKKCGTEFKMNVNDNGSAAQVGPDGATPADGGSELPGGKKPPMKTVKSQTLNHAAVAHATELIGAGKVSEDAWAKPKDSELDEKLCLAIDASQPKENAGRLDYPVGMDGKVYRSAVANCEARAAAEGESSIAAAAKTLMEAIQKRDKAETSKAAKAELKSMMPAILDEARATAREELLMRMGRLI
jgi:DNA-directed RNA polymerase subunit RPC12/RpoP